MNTCGHDHSISAKHREEPRFESGAFPDAGFCACCNANHGTDEMYCDACLTAECGEQKIGASCRAEKE